MTEHDKQMIWKDTYIREVRVNYVTSDKRISKVGGPSDVADFVRSVLIDNSREQFVALYLDAANCVVSYSVITIGTANQTLFHPREIFQRAVLVGAIALAVAHNHPSGEVEPSKEDIYATHRLKEAGFLLGIKFLDHVIVSDHSFTSLREDKRCWDS
jgi:DNA repair protein RadC